MNHVQARAVFAEAFRLIFMRDPSRSEVQCLQAVAYLETQYGAGWHGAGKGSFNMGAIQSGRPPCDPRTSFQYTDTHPNADGTSSAYHICFRKYATAVEGAEDLCLVMYKRRPSVLAAATAGDSYGVSAALRSTNYYEGFGRDQQERIANHHRALLRHLTAIAAANQEPLPDGGSPPPPTIRRGSNGETVKDWQRILHILADGQFGPHTERITKEWQQSHRLKPDGVVGPATWEAARKYPDTEPGMAQFHTGSTIRPPPQGEP